MIEVDIHTKLIDPATRIWVVRPGAKYRLFSSFYDNEVVGPDLPFLDLPNLTEIKEIEDLDARVERAMALRKWYGQREDERDAFLRDLSNYTEVSSTRSSAQFRRVVRAFFHDMRKGDLIVMPPGPFKGDAYIGELTSDPHVTKEIVVGFFPGDPITGRQVKWLGTIPKSDLPPQTLDALQKPSPLFLLVRPAWPTIFRRAYGSYHTENEYSSRFEITEAKFRTIDDFHIQAFFNFIAANTKIIEDGGDDLLDLKDGAFKDLGEAAPELYTNVNSPGGISLKSALITPIVIAAMLGLAVTVGPDAINAVDNNLIVFGNSKAPADDPCVAHVREQVVTQLRLLGYERWAQACEVAQKAAENTGISTSVDVVKK